MTKKLFLLLALTSSLSANAAEPSFNTPADLSEIRRIEELVQPTLNMDSIIKYYAPDAVTLDLWAPGVYRGQQSIRDNFQVWLNPVSSLTMIVEEMNVASDGEFACALMQLRFNAELKDGKKYSMAVRTLDALRKTGGQWQIHQQHVALPLSTENNRAIYNETAPAGKKLFASGKGFTAGPAIAVDRARTEIAQWNAARFSASDAQALASLYGPGEDSLLYGMFFPGVSRGASAIGQDLAQQRTGNSAADGKLDSLLQTNGRLAIQISTREINLTDKQGNKQRSIQRQSNCLRRVNGSWHSFFELSSVIVDVNTALPIPAPVGSLSQTAEVPKWGGAIKEVN